MEKFYKVKVKTMLEDDKGKIKKVNEDYLTKSTGCTEAEAAVVEFLSASPFEFEVVTVTETKFVEVV